MSVEELTVQRQHSFRQGPNYTDPPFSLAEDELADSQNVVWDQGLKVIPGAARLVSTAFPGGGALTSVHKYEQNSGTKYFITTSNNDVIGYRTSGNWTSLSSTYNGDLRPWPKSIVFNNSFIITNGRTMMAWGGPTGTFHALAGSPPAAKYLSVQGDFILATGHDGTEVRYSDTATATTWPVSNIVNIGLDDGEQINAVVPVDEYNLFVKDRSVWYLAGYSPVTFAPKRLATLGSRAPNMICWTPKGLFMWTEGGPGFLQGRQVILPTRRMRRLLDSVDWVNVDQGAAAYYPMRNWVVMSLGATLFDGYTSVGLILDLNTLTDDDIAFWPFTTTGTSFQSLPDANGRRRVYIGTSDSYVLEFDNGTTWNASTVVGRARSKVFVFGNPGSVWGLRDMDWWLKAQAGNAVIKYAVDGNQTFTTKETVAMAKTGYDFQLHRAHGALAGGHIVGRAFQSEITNSTTGFAAYGLEMGAVKIGRRDA
jgi:hypothetical protein